MPASQGTPTIWDKINALFNQHSTDPTVQETLAGDKRDIQKALSIFQPILQSAETTGLGDLTNFLQVLLAAVPQITSLQHASAIVQAVLAAEKGPLQQQATSLGQSAMTALISAGLAAVGKNVPLVG